MLSWSTEPLIQDGRSQSEIRQRVTTEIMGEGESMGPGNDRVCESMLKQQKGKNSSRAPAKRPPKLAKCADRATRGEPHQ